MNWLPKLLITDFKTHLEYRVYCKLRATQLTNYMYRNNIYKRG